MSIYKNHPSRSEGKTPKDRFDNQQRNTLIRGFKKSDGWCEVDVTSPNLEVVKIQAHIHNPSIKSFGFKHIACHPEMPITQGSIIHYTDGKKYIAVDVDIHSNIQVFGKIFLLNNPINFYLENGDIATTYGVDNESLAIQDNARQVPLTEGRRNIWLQRNELTEQFYKNMRFIFGGKEAYKITFIDNWSREGMILCRFEVTQILPEDDMENSVAHNTDKVIVDEEDDMVEPTVSEIKFSKDSFKIYRNMTDKVSVFEYDSDGEPMDTTFTFEVIGIGDGDYSIVNVDGNEIEIRANRVYRKGTLRATSDTDGSYAEIDIELLSMF